MLPEWEEPGRDESALERRLKMGITDDGDDVWLGPDLRTPCIEDGCLYLCTGLWCGDHDRSITANLQD